MYCVAMRAMTAPYASERLKVHLKNWFRLHKLSDDYYYSCTHVIIINYLEGKKDLLRIRPRRVQRECDPARALCSCVLASARACCAACARGERALSPPASARGAENTSRCHSSAHCDTNSKRLTSRPSSQPNTNTPAKMGGVFAKALGRLVGKKEMRILMVRQRATARAASPLAMRRKPRC